MHETYTVEILNLGRRPVVGVDTRTETFADLATATQALQQAVGELALRPDLSLLDAGHRQDVGADGILAAARLSHIDDGGRVEVLLRRRTDVESLPDPDHDA